MIYSGETAKSVGCVVSERILLEKKPAQSFLEGLDVLVEESISSMSAKELKKFSKNRKSIMVEVKNRVKGSGVLHETAKQASSTLQA
jgi:hypothetical protein